MIDNAKIQFSESIQYIPVTENKRPVPEAWQTTKREYDFSTAKGIGLVCGKLSGNVEAIDFDLKYDISGKLFSEYKKLINTIAPGLLKKLVVQKTISGGYHFIYRCSHIEGNQKIAQRHANEQEQQNGDKVKVLIETRGEGGMIVCYPSKGYELKQGSFDKIPLITPEERSTLINIAFSFNEVLKPEVHKAPKERKKSKGLTPIEDYDERGDVVELLEKHGWTVVGRKGVKILLKRPGDTKAEHSGNFDEERNCFSVFSTSTVFEAQTPYKPYAVFCMLECNGEWREVPKRLRELGYGDDDEVIKSNNEPIPSVIDTSDDDDLSFLATGQDYDQYLHAWRTKTFEMGKTTGVPELDEHFLFKEGNLVIVNGLDNVGKSSFVWYLAMLSALLHDWNWIIYSSENREGGVVRKLIEFYWCEPIDSLTEEKYKIAKNFVEDHFSIIKRPEKLYNYQDILNMATKAMKNKKYKGLMIDPYNSLKVDIPSKSKQQIYDYHYEAASVIQSYCKLHNICVYLNCHVGTVGARNKDRSGYTKAPQKEDTEGGVMFANKADDFLTIHRVTQHETDWMYTEVHIRKIKETETGGKVTYYHRPVDFTMVNKMSGFTSVPNRGKYGEGTNGVLNYHRSKSIPELNLTQEPIAKSQLQDTESFINSDIYVPSEPKYELVSSQLAENEEAPF